MYHSGSSNPVVIFSKYFSAVFLNAESSTGFSSLGRYNEQKNEGYQEESFHTCQFKSGAAIPTDEMAKERLKHNFFYAGTKGLCTFANTVIFSIKVWESLKEK
jgi:hypothetical protein